MLVLRAELGVFASPSLAAEMPSGWEDLPLVLVHGARYDSRTKKWTLMTLMTNLVYDPDTQLVGEFSFEQLMELYRRRWDIEIHFKFLKQHLSYDHLLSRCENGIRVMIYMSLIAAVLLIWFQRQTGIDRGWRSVKFWFGPLRSQLDRASAPGSVGSATMLSEIGLPRQSALQECK